MKYTDRRESLIAIAIPALFVFFFTAVRWAFMFLALLTVGECIA